MVRHPQGYVKGEPVDLDLVVIDSGMMLEKRAAEAFFKMRAAAHVDGVELVVNTAFRTWEWQEKKYAKYKKDLDYWTAIGKPKDKRPPPVAPPGFSQHQGGVALDIETKGGTNNAFHWLENHAGNYGFKRTVASEPWHWCFKPEETGASA